MTCQLSELIPSLTVNKVFINVRDLDYKELCERFELTTDVVTINSNFSHKALEGYEKYITKSKLEKSKGKSVSSRKVVGDGSTFNSSIEFIILLDNNTKLLHYYSRMDKYRLLVVNMSKS